MHAAFDRDPGRGEVVAELEQLVGDAETGQDLQGAGLDGQGAGLVDPVVCAVDEAGPHPVRGELGGQGQAGRSGADDEDLDRVAGHDLTV